MNDRARQIWREHAELLHEKHVDTLQSQWILLGQRYKWAVEVIEEDKRDIGEGVRYSLKFSLPK